MAISPVAAGITPVAPIQMPTDLAGVSGVSAADSQDFTSAFVNSLQKLQDVQGTADNLSKLAATGDTSSVEAQMAAMTEAQLATQLTVAVRNKAIESFNEIMRMQL